MPAGWVVGRLCHFPSLKHFAVFPVVSHHLSQPFHLILATLPLLSNKYFLGPHNSSTLKIQPEPRPHLN